MAWLDFIFGQRKPSPTKQRDTLRWTSHRGDEWWCGDAGAGYSCDNFTIGSFGKFTAPEDAIELIVDARNAFPDATIDVYLDNDTELVVRALNEQRLIESREIRLSPKSRVARIECITACRSLED